MLIYRDTKTGRFAKKSTWKRSKARGGTRYVRQKVSVKIDREPQEIEREQEPTEEITGGFDSP